MLPYVCRACHASAVFDGLQERVVALAAAVGSHGIPSEAPEGQSAVLRATMNDISV